jgi:hypothetical protein
LTHREVTAGATGGTAVAPKFSDALTLFQPGGQILPHHRRGCTKIFPVVTSLLRNTMKKKDLKFAMVVGLAQLKITVVK